MNLNDLIFTGADFKLFLSIPNGAIGGTYQLLSTDAIDLNVSVEDELIYAVGSEDPIGNKQNARKRTGKLIIQLGEIYSMLALEGLLDATYVNGATLAVTAIQGAFERTWKQVNFNTDNLPIKGKDKQTLVTIDFSALSAV